MPRWDLLIFGTANRRLHVMFPNLRVGAFWSALHKVATPTPNLVATLPRDKPAARSSRALNRRLNHPNAALTQSPGRFAPRNAFGPHHYYGERPFIMMEPKHVVSAEHWHAGDDKYRTAVLESMAVQP